MTERLRRLERLYTAYPLYFVTACTQDRKPLLANERVHAAFLAFCRTGLTRGVFVGRYVLMPDHLHLFVRFGQEYESSLIDRRREKLDDPVAAAALTEAALTERRYSSAGHGDAAADAVAAVYDRRGDERRGDDRRGDERRGDERRDDDHVSPLSCWMKSLRNSLSKTLNAIGQPAPHWQKGFFDHVMRSAESYSEKWQYMVENPVRAGLTKAWEDWPWQGEIYALTFSL